MVKSVLIDFNKLNNARDLGGMKTSDGRTIKSGKLIRSEHLTDVSKNDEKKLLSIIDTVIDLRTNEERNDDPDVALDGVDNLHIPIIESLAQGISADGKIDLFLQRAMTSSPERSKKHMCDMYGSFVQSDFSVSQFSKFIKVLKRKREKAVLFHCTAGKDRAGTASALIELILGVSKNDVTADYLRTNEYLQKNIIDMTKRAKNQVNITDVNADKALYYLFAADEEYITSFYNAIESRFGGLNSFIENGLKLTKDDVALLKRLYLE